jgi:methylenetetrahydrofolate dehydrogenase (NADP+) / methenyltetrahydrofolate cyclohydrolase
METKILKGESIKDRILAETRIEISELKSKHDRVPGIAFIGFEGVPLAKYTVPMHVHLAEELGFRVYLEMKPENVTEKEVFSQIETLNRNNDIHAIVILQPVPAHLNAMRISNRIRPEKEVEGFHPQNMMATMLPTVLKNNYPMCLPEALMEIFREGDIRPQPDQEWVFLLDEEFLANPLTRMIVHSAALKVVPDYCSTTFVTRNSANRIDHCKRADFLVIVTKHPEYVQPEWLKPGVCIIDIYSNLVKEIPGKNDPLKLVPVIRGGITAAMANGIAGSILPIPGGLMTTVLAILFRNAVTAFRQSLEKKNLYSGEIPSSMVI